MSGTDVIQLNLKWDNFSSHLALSFDSCYESQQFVDVSLVCKDGEVIKGHKMILANTSKFFHRLLTENEHPHPMIVLHNIDADDLRNLMTFMYCGEVQIFQNDLKKLLEIADTLEITGLQQIQELDKPGTRFGGENFVGLNANNNRTDDLKCNTDYEIIPDHCSKPASNLLKYVSNLGQKNCLESPLVQSFESSSRKLQEMARKFDKCPTGTESWSFLQQMQNSNTSKAKRMANDCGQKKLQVLRDEREPEELEFNSSSRKLQEMANLLENVNRSNSSLEEYKEVPNDQKWLLDSVEETTEPPLKKLNVSQDAPNTSETESGVEAMGQAISEQEVVPGRSVDGEQLLHNCNIIIKDEVEVATECSTSPDIDSDNLPTDNLIENNVEYSRPGMLAADLLKAVAFKRKAVESALNEGCRGSFLGVLPEQNSTINLAKNQDRKLAFHEPRPCDICNRVYRDAATLRQHTFTMHSAGTHFCGCGAYFYTKYELLAHKKQAHF